MNIDRSNVFSEEIIFYLYLNSPHQYNVLNIGMNRVRIIILN